MTTLTDQLGLLEAERDRIKAENESLKIRISKQAGALEESRAQVRQLIARNEKLKGYATQLREHIYTFHGALDRIAKKDNDLAEADKIASPQPTVADVPQAPADTPMKSLLRRLGGVEAPMNGAAA